ncbi:MAG: hypothetical protein WCY21_02765 [Candidatus Cloacimonadaceae bacterium]|jgi:hypothetical protein|nr:hypothetical protein [Candidatus Cloacimonadota bacterium]MDX9949283.1 hypothetical protein [Candidatus Syntrophosphaera sp.]NLN85466.1 hypothetical protein [Candidatus Cloacimonadota bacterium]
MTPTFYFKINLNKYGEIKLQTERENRNFRNAVIGFGVGALIMFALLLTFHNSLKKKAENRKQYLREISSQLSDFEASEDFLSVNDVTRLADTFNDRIFWTKKLEALSSEIDQQIAVKKFQYNNGVLTLYGIIEVNPRVQEGDVIYNFVQRLRSNPQISDDFPEIKSGSRMRQVAKDTEILEFQVECRTQGADGPARGGDQ